MSHASTGIGMRIRETTKKSKEKKKPNQLRQRDIAETILHQHLCAPIPITDSGCHYRHIISYVFVTCRIVVVVAARQHSHIWHGLDVPPERKMLALYYLAHGVSSKQESEASKVIYFVQGGDEEMRKGTSMARR
jgi:hypothetical protein